MSESRITKMNTLKQMFGEKFDDDTIMAALVKHNGSLERALDFLLTKNDVVRLRSIRFPTHTITNIQYRHKKGIVRM